MDKLINKGGFRERANRSRVYKNSENQQTTLNQNQYTPQKKKENINSPSSKTSSTPLEQD
ncbi:hypothetical protein [Acinetobacter stercoris]|uniref:Uncharacterized protein n=1 Tax=Acinetobacter stercoris TaxID=2126983 RepID=A0A2U3N368_9GAMM|nr:MULTISPECIES: hypothetical protein [Acinetobacter]SPL72121.1 hypothetical protein KPC_3299 [Acinetobacter stercoris]